MTEQEQQLVRRSANKFATRCALTADQKLLKSEKGLYDLVIVKNQSLMDAQKQMDQSKIYDEMYIKMENLNEFVKPEDNQIIQKNNALIQKAEKLKKLAYVHQFDKQSQNKQAEESKYEYSVFIDSRGRFDMGSKQDRVMKNRSPKRIQRIRVQGVEVCNEPQYDLEQGE